MKRILGIISFFILFIMIPSESAAAQQTIQSLINQAEDGDTIHLPEGTYEESIVIDKQIKLIGNDKVYLKVHDHQPAITIHADNVVLKHISINYHSDKQENAAILLKSNYNELKQIKIETDHRGILLDEAHHNTLTNLTIKGNEQLPIQSRQRGIDLWQANENTIVDVSISHVEDGIYLESSANNILHRNLATHSRYGYHLMFTRDTELYANESYENISGMMIMGTNRTKIYENTLKYNQRNVQSLGLLLFDVRDALIERNEITDNRIGVFVEDATQNELMYNDINHNFIGLQFKRAENNKIHHNSFTANVVQGQAEESMHNKTNNNYWSDHHGLDINGDRLSNLPYKVDPFYLHLTNEYPPYRLLFQAPGMIFLENMMHTPVEEQLVDQSPLMDYPLEISSITQEDHGMTLLISTIIFAFSLLIIYVGVRK